MRKRYSVRFVLVFSVLLGLAGCAMPPSPRGGAPVVDRSIRPVPPPPQVEVQPLPQPEPIVAQEYSGAQPNALPRTPEQMPPGSGSPPQTGGVQTTTPSSTEMSRQGNPAVVALLDSAEGHVANEAWDKAAADLERALRIEPRNAGIWHDLAQIRLQQRQYEQVESLASKSNSLAGNDNFIRARNWRLIAIVRRAQGDEAGAYAAEAQANVLEQ